ncbi:FAD-dependent oxidoreductase [Pontibaca methylaminivorans]|uniref:FAD-dependent oxidoreductase n=1 Tax=Pontibaca methylaminivorans TaxID=515897 RepID=UPI002FDA63BF
MTDFTMEKDTEGVATITWDVAGKSMNVMSFAGLRELDGLIDAALADPAVKGIVITSGKADSFAGGMDLNLLGRMKDTAGDDPAQSLFESVMQIHTLLRKVERAGMDPKTQKGGKPIAAVLPGTALGIGLELPLATHRIFAAANPRARIGFPEILVGIFPGAGGTTRLMRKLGAMAAAPFLLEGKLVAPERARSAGLIDEVCDDPLTAARDWVLAATDADLVKPWDRKGYRMPGGAPYHPSGYMTFVGASAMVNGRTKGALPAPKALLSAAYEGALVDFDTALRIEARWFTNILLNPSSGAMIRSLFVNKQALEKGAMRPENIPDRRISRLGVVGAGMMGAGIALVAARAGIDVVLIDRDQAAAERGRAHAETYLSDGVKRGKTTPAQRDATLARITPATDPAQLRDCDLVIEAVFEDMAVKTGILREIGAHIGKDCILATNTSTLPIGDLAQASTAPERFIGIHFFSPVERMALVEIIKGRETGVAALASALDFVRQIRKTPITVNDARFFYANRCIIPYINEGLRMVCEGTVLPLIDHAAEQLGFPVGPIRLTDETSIALAAQIARATRAAAGGADPENPADDLIFWMEEQGRLGRKAGAGFFDYDDKGKRQGYWSGLAARYPAAETQPALAEMQDRLILAQVLEAVRALEAGVLEDIREGDVGAVLGWGFAPWSGGPFSWIDITGPREVARRADRLAAQHGPRFACPPLLREMAGSGARFYDRFAAEPRSA